MAEGFLATRLEVNDNLPAQVTGLKSLAAVVSGKGQVTVSWTNPGSYFAGVLIVKKAGSAPAGVWDGQAVYNGTGTSFVDTGVAFDTTYYYRAYPCNPRRQYQTQGAVTTVTPKAGKKLSELPEGGLVKLQESGVGALFYLAKHNYESGLNGAGRTLLVRKDCYDNRQWHTSSVSTYASSAIDSWLGSTYKNLFSADIRTVMGTTSFYYTPGKGNNTVTTLQRAVFLLSMTELGQSHRYANTEGSALPIAATLKIAYLNGSANTQWTRSPYTDNIYYSWRLRTDGSVNSNECSDANGSRPAFTLPADFLLKPAMNSDGSYSPLDE